MTWVDVENAIQAAIVTASGFNAAAVTWRHQNVNEPIEDHIVISFGGETRVGQDYIRTGTDLTRPVGQEISQDIGGTREVTFELEVFTTAVDGDQSARRIAEVIRTRLRLTSVRDQLTAVGLTPFDPGPVSFIPDLSNTKWRGRAICAIRCYVPVFDATEYTTYIEKTLVTVIPVGWTSGTGATSFIVSNSGVTFAPSTLSPVYYGSAVDPGTYNSGFVTGFAQQQKLSRAGSFTYVALAGQKCFLWLPTAFGASLPGFTDDATGEPAGVSLVQSGLSVGGVSYDGWMTDVAGLGTWTMDVI